MDCVSMHSNGLTFYYGAIPWVSKCLIYWPLGYLFKNLTRLTTNKPLHSTLHALCAGNQPVTGGFPAQWASNTESMSMSCVKIGQNSISPENLQTISFHSLCAMTTSIYVCKYTGMMGISGTTFKYKFATTVWKLTAASFLKSKFSCVWYYI